VNRMHLSLATAALIALSVGTLSAKDKASEAFLKKAIEGNYAEVKDAAGEYASGQIDTLQKHLETAKSLKPGK
jgi:putative membrane protein